MLPADPLIVELVLQRLEAGDTVLWKTMSNITKKVTGVSYQYVKIEFPKFAGVVPYIDMHTGKGLAIIPKDEDFYTLEKDPDHENTWILRHLTTAELNKLV